MKANPAGSPSETERDAHIADIVEELVRRRYAGEQVSDQEIIDNHPELMPELGQKLSALRLINEAERRAKRETDLETRATDAAGVRSSYAESIPGCVLLEELHRGGQGKVYRAKRKSTGRDVAVKVMREGPLFGSSDAARFDREIRILGQLQHPNIATIHDSGVADGCHFFVMDYIPGETLDRYVAQRRLSVADCLRLFMKICKTVNAAHLRGVIHRDLKPGNILIDRQGEPHILDFGLAKFATEDVGDTTQRRHMTMTGQFVGSLPWASPEQAESPSSGIDLRTDLYSLGVVLYHMLTGQFPYPVSANMREVLSNIIERPPVRLRALRGDIDEDVETIVLKCLEKERERRYQNAAALGEDIERYLANQPILAHAPSTMYQFKKLVVRHKIPFAFLAATLAFAGGSAIWMGILYGRAARERNRALAAEREANAIQEFLVRDMLDSAQPEVALGRKMTVEDVLDNASRRIEGAFAEEPLLEASVRATLGKTYVSLALYEAAEVQLRGAEGIRARELGNEHPLTLRSRIALVDLLHRMGKYKEAEPLAVETLASTWRVLGEDHEDTLEAAYQRANSLWFSGKLAESLALHRETLERRRRVLGEENPDTLKSLNECGFQAWIRQGKTREADDLLHRAMDASRQVYGEAHPETFKAMRNIGDVLMIERKLTESEALLREALQGQRRVLGNEHPDSILTMIQLGVVLQERALHDEAEALYRQAAAVCRKQLGNDHPITQECMLHLGKTLWRQCEYVKAAEILQKVWEQRRRIYGDNHEETALALSYVSYVLEMLGRYEEAEVGHRRAVDAHHRALGAGSPVLAWPLQRLVKVLAAQGKLEEARPFAEELLALRKTSAEGDDSDAYQLNCYARELLTIEPSDLRDPQLALATAQRAFGLSSDAYHYNRYALALAYDAIGDLDMAIEMDQRALAHTPIEVSEERRDYETALVRFYEQAGDGQAAEQVYRDTLVARREQFPQDHPDIASSLEDLGVTLLRHGQFAEAEPLFRECLDIRRSAFLSDWRIAYAMSLLSESLLGQGRFAEAEPLALDACDGLSNNAWAPSEQVRHAMQNIVDLYDAWGKAARADEYRAALEEYRPTELRLLQPVQTTNRGLDGGEP